MLYRSSSTGGFGLSENFKPVRSQVAAWGKKHAMAELVQEKGTKVETNSVKKMPNKVAAVTAAKQHSEKPKQSAKVVFTIGSPIQEENSLEPERINNSNSGKHFTEVCAWPQCKKDIIAGKDDVYMYGYLQAFCSDECRYKQIASDEKSRPSSPQSRGGSYKSVIRPEFARTRATKVVKINCSERLDLLAR